MRVLRRSESLGVPNFIKIQLSYNYFRFGKTNSRHIEILLPVSILTCQSSSACNSASVFQILCESVISGVVMTSLKLSRWRPLTSRINFRFQFLWCACPQKSRISKYTKFRKDLKPWLNYNYFRVGKTNGCHIEILLPVSILTCQSSSVCNFASSFQISYESDRWRPTYDVMSIFKMADVSHVVFPIR